MQVILTNISSIASILGLIITLITLLKVSNIQKFYIFKATIPDQTLRLSELNGEIVRLLSDCSQNKDEIIERIIKMETIVNSLSNKVNRNFKNKTNELLKCSPRSNYTEDNVRLFYEKTLSLVCSIQEELRDKEWEAK